MSLQSKITGLFPKAGEFIIDRSAKSVTFDIEGDRSSGDPTIQLKDLKRLAEMLGTSAISLEASSVPLPRSDGETIGCITVNCAEVPPEKFPTES